jgi:phenylacetate-coenzyme A ligase PaaK-like adenylate-forming protein
LRTRTLEELLNRARTHPVYAARLQGVTSFDQVPLLTKAELRQVLRSLETSPEFRDGTYWSPSGCSTARARFFFPTDVQENHYQRQVFARTLLQQGVLKPGVIALNLFAGTLMYRACEIFTEFTELCGATVLPMTSAAPLEKAYEIADRFQVNTVMGSTSRLLALARFVALSGFDLKIEKAVFAGEPLTDPIENCLRESLGVKELFGVYGSAETGVWGLSREPDLDCYTVSRDLMHLEQVDGKIVATNLVRYRHPVLRYEMGDMGTVAATEFGWSVKLDGREERTIEFNGRVYGLSEIALLARDSLDYQVVLPGADELKLRVVGLDGPAVDELEDRLRALLGPSVTVESVSPDKLQRAAGSDKVVRIVQKAEAVFREENSIEGMSLPTANPGRCQNN